MEGELGAEPTAWTPGSGIGVRAQQEWPIVIERSRTGERDRALQIVLAAARGGEGGVPPVVVEVGCGS